MRAGHYGSPPSLQLGRVAQRARIACVLVIRAWFGGHGRAMASARLNERAGTHENQSHMQVNPAHCVTRKVRGAMTADQRRATGVDMLFQHVIDQRDARAIQVGVGFVQ